MKHLLVLLNTLVLILALMFALNMYLTVAEMEKELQAVQKINDTRIEELNKEVRLLKTDVDIIQYGFEKELDK